MEQNKQTIYASPALRLLAHIFDLLLTWFILAAAFYFISGSSGHIQLFNNTLLVLLLLLLLGLSGGVIYSYMTSSWGGSPGKLAYGLRVIDYEGVFLSFKKALFRNYIARSVANLFFGMGYFWIIKDSKRQGWHDMSIDSYVIRNQSNYWIVGIIGTLLLFAGIIFLLIGSINNITSNPQLYTQLFA